MARRSLILPTLVALAAAALCGWTELVGYLWTDYEQANERPLRALVHGDLRTFFVSSPIEGPSLLLRAPFALASWLWGASDLAIYRLVAVPGLLAGALLGVVLFAEARLRAGPAWAWVPLGLAAANPITLEALRIGHPEEILGGVLCVLAVLTAQRGRAAVAAVLLGLAVANKAWAVLAVGPVLLALDRGHWRALALAAGTAALFVLPFLLVSASSRASLAVAAETGGVWQPWQVLWFLGEPAAQVEGFYGIVKEDWRTAPAGIGVVTHPLIVVLGAVLAGAFALRRRRHAVPDVLGLLALCLLLRCVLDVANNVYYHAPFLLALLAWEARGSRPPVWTLVATALTWFTVGHPPAALSPDAQSLVYCLWAVPAVVVLAAAAFGLRPPRPSARVPGSAPAAGPSAYGLARR